MEHLFTFYFWAVLVWIFAVAAVSVVLYRYCTHQPARRKLKPKTDIIVVIIILTLFMIATAVNSIVFIEAQITRHPSFPTTILVAIITPLMMIIYASLLIIRQIKIIRNESKILIAVTDISVLTYDSFGSMAPTYRSLPIED